MSHESQETEEVENDSTGNFAESEKGSPFVAQLAKRAKPGLRLTPRDWDLLQFLQEQRFASLPILYYRFFDRRTAVSDPLPANFWVARQRLALLRQAGLIRSEKVFTEGRALSVLTRQGYELLKTQRELGLYAEPPESIDFRTYEHDKRVTLCRVALEREGKSYRWYPDRFLRHKRGYPLELGFIKLPFGLVPDGVFISSKSERIAFELELTPKKRERYQEKREAYIGLMTATHLTQDRSPPIHRVFFIACSDRIGKDLQEILGRSDRFVVRSYESLVGGRLGPEALL